MARRTIPSAPALNLGEIPSRKPLVDVTIAVVTPLFGGGFETGQTVDDLPIRASSVRGHLRFWWRACNAHRYPSAKTLFHKEADLWGQTHQDGIKHAPSAIDVEIEIIKAGDPINCVTWTWNEHTGRYNTPRWGIYPGYALFPFQGTPPRTKTDEDAWEKPPRKPLSGTTFKLKLFWSVNRREPPSHAIQEAIEDTVRAWVLFGGVGARTRRGCGSLWCSEARGTPVERFRPRTSQPSDVELDDWVRVGSVWLPKFDDGHGPRSLPVPVLAASNVVVGRSERGAIGAWTRSVDIMRKFRQTPDGREPTEPRPGMSYWPEPYALRAAWPTLDPPHAAFSHPAAPSYPRADLGLPIIFQQMHRVRDPKNPELEGALNGARRMASPVILKALAVSETDACPLALLLDAPHVWDKDMPGVRRVWAGAPSGSDEVSVSQAQLQPSGSAALSPDLKGLMPEGRTAREGFINYASNALGQPAPVSL